VPDARSVLALRALAQKCCPLLLNNPQNPAASFDAVAAWNDVKNDWKPACEIVCKAISGVADGHLFMPFDTLFAHEVPMNTDASHNTEKLADDNPEQALRLVAELAEAFPALVAFCQATEEDADVLEQTTSGDSLGPLQPFLLFTGNNAPDRDTKTPEKLQPKTYAKTTVRPGLYTARQFAQETRLVNLLLSRLLAPDLVLAGERAASSDQDDVVPQSTNKADTTERQARIATAIAGQAAAVEKALGSRLFVLGGGPGTGKTTTVFHLLRAWYKAGYTRVALAAPTGRAARRLSESLLDSASRFQPKTEGDRAFAGFIAAISARTVDRLVGHGRDTASLTGVPLAECQVLVVDEASMLDTEHFSAILEKLPADAALVLVGDADQLPSVEDGTILSDLVALAENICLVDPSTQYPKWYAHLDVSVRSGGETADLPRALVGRDAKTGSGTNQLATASFVEVVEKGLRQGQVLTQHAGELPSPGAAPQSWTYSAKPDFATRAKLVELLSEFYLDRHAKGTEPDELETVLSTWCLLSPVREGFWGAATINRLVIARYLQRYRAGVGSVSGGETPVDRSRLAPGMPVMVLKNDPGLSVANGDRGIVQKGRANTLVVRFSHLPQPIPLEFLPSWEPGFAMTIHKSQGSEYRHVLVVLDPHGRPCTRELLYTALTRARESWHLVASLESVAAAANNSTERWSRLRDRLYSGLGFKGVEPPKPKNQTSRKQTAGSIQPELF